MMMRTQGYFLYRFLLLICPRITPAQKKMPDEQGVVWMARFKFVSPALGVKTSVFRSHIVGLFVFRMILRTNSGYFPK
jgi:hypothetical protein